MSSKVLNIIQKNGAMNLADYEGSCPCGSFEVGGIKVWFHCWKSGRCKDCTYSGVHVERVHDDTTEPLEPIAKQVMRELKEVWSNTDWEIRL